MRRVLSTWLPNLAVERWAKTSGCAPDSPVVLTIESTHGPIIHAVTRTAAGRGASVGARLTDARALDPGLVAVPADPDGDLALVQRLARWAGRWSPLVEVDGTDGLSTALETGLRLDVTGVSHLFGGEAGLVADVRERFAAMGLTVRVAIAPTAGAAWALARFSTKPSPLGGEGDSATAERGEGCGTIVLLPHSPHPPAASRRVPPSLLKGEGLSSLLAPLPVAALRLPEQATRTLERLGLKTIGALAGVPRRSLARRFREAHNPIDALDRMLGRKPEPLTATPSEPPPRVLLRLEEPVVHPEAATQALERLVPKLVRELERKRLGARHLTLTGFRVDGSIAVASVATSIASREPRHLARLLSDKAAALDPGFGFDAFTLEASWAEPLGAAQASLVEEPSGERDVARLVDRLTVKLGTERVRRPVVRESHVPERASGWAAALRSSSPLYERGKEAQSAGRVRGMDATLPSPSHSAMPSGPRPLPQGGEGLSSSPQRLLDRPEMIDVMYATPEGVPRRFVWRRVVHDIARVEGPKRIAPEWWRERSTARLRDYYRVEDGDGRRYWIYREGVVGDGRGGAPAWFLHGLFG
jgi:protein ImuB